MPPSLNASELRKIINQTLATDTSFDAFVIDYFPYVYSRFSNGMDRISRINILLTYISPDDIFQALRNHGNYYSSHKIPPNLVYSAPDDFSAGDRASVRRLLRAVLRTDADLDAFIIDHFSDIYANFSRGMSYEHKVNLLLEREDPATIELYCKRDSLYSSRLINHPNLNRQRLFSRTASFVGKIYYYIFAFPFVALYEFLVKSKDVITKYINDRRKISSALSAPRPDDDDEMYRPVRLLVVFAQVDSDSSDQLCERLKSLIKEQAPEIEECVLIPSTEAAPSGLADLQKRVEWADVVAFLLSPELISHPQAVQCIEQSLERRKRGEAQVLPIVIRPAPVRRSQLARLPLLPASGRAISIWRVPSIAWDQVERELRVAVYYRPTRALAPEPPRSPTPLERRLIGQIFCLNGVPEETFVPPQQFSRLQALLQNRGQGLAIEGPSGIGKTTAVKKALGTTKAEWIRCLEAADLKRLDRLLKGSIETNMVVDDFHYLDDERKQQLARRLKTMADDAGPGKIIVIGIQDVYSSLVRQLPDLAANRLMSIRIEAQGEKELTNLLTKGEQKANIEFRHRAELINAAVGSFAILQQLCFNVATAEGVTETRLNKLVVAKGLPEILDQMREQLASDFYEPLRRLVVEDAVSPPRGAMMALLWLLRDAPRYTICIEDARQQFPFLSPAFDWLLGGNLARIIGQVQEKFSHLSRLLFFDPQAATLSVEDPRLIFYLRYQDWERFLDATGHRSLRLDETGDLVPVIGAEVATPKGTSVKATPVRSSAPLRSRSGVVIPAGLRDELASGRVVPFVGSLVSSSVMKQGASGVLSTRLLPSWAELLERAAQKLEENGAPGDAKAVRGSIEKRFPNYLEALRNAREGLGPAWYAFLKEALDPPFSSLVQDSLALARTIWELGSNLVVTTCQDRVLRWACPASGRDDLMEWRIEAPAELAALLRRGVDRPTVWHLHGSIDDAANLVLTPDGFSRLYPETDAQGHHYQAALTALRILLASRTLLFVGFDQSAQGVSDQLRWVSEIFAGANGPHYLLVREAELALIRERLRDLPLELIPFPDQGHSLIELLRDLSPGAHGGPNIA